MSFDTTYDYLQQSVSNAINQFQPDYGNIPITFDLESELIYYFLERTLREVISSLPSCELRLCCEVLSRVEDERGVIVNYTDNEGNDKRVRTSWLVGADGKRGIVRKKFLEPEGIIQEVGL